MALCISESVYHHRTRGVDLSEAVFPAAVFEMLICRSVCHGAAHVLLGALYLEIPEQSFRPQIFYRIGVCDEDRVSRHVAAGEAQYPNVSHVAGWAVAFIIDTGHT